MEAKPIRIIYNICRVLGLSCVRYVSERRRFEQVTGPALAYVIALHILYLLVTPCVVVVMVDSFYRCEKLDMLAVAFSVVALSKAFLTLFLLCHIWLQRKLFRRFANGFLIMCHMYSNYIFNYSYWRRNFWRLAQCSSRFVGMLHLHFGPGSTLTCEKSSHIEDPAVAIYITLFALALLMELGITCVDYSIYFMQDTCNSMLGCMTQEVQQLTQDLCWLPQRRGDYRTVYQQQLLVAWQRIWRRSMRLDNLHDKMLHSFQWHLLIGVFTSYLTELTIVFDLVIYINFAEVSLWRTIFCLLVCAMFHLDAVSHFHVFSYNHVQWVNFMSSIQSLWIALKSMNSNEDEDLLSKALTRQLEFAVIFLNRKLQQRPEKVRRLHIVGLFDLSNKTGMQRGASIVLNVIVLWQIAYKNYY